MDKQHHDRREKWYRQGIIRASHPQLGLLLRKFLTQMDGAWADYFDRIEAPVKEALMAYG